MYCKTFSYFFLAENSKNNEDKVQSVANIAKGEPKGGNMNQTIP